MSCAKMFILFCDGWGDTKREKGQRHTERCEERQADRNRQMYTKSQKDRDRQIYQEREGGGKVGGREGEREREILLKGDLQRKIK